MQTEKIIVIQEIPCGAFLEIRFNKETNNITLNYPDGEEVATQVGLATGKLIKEIKQCQI